ncbi:MAG TPA: toprim domain-containing protein [Solirubrobacter sp.]|nr:toprim domain-containing protein [Solirubrobacter sp.]
MTDDPAQLQQLVRQLSEENARLTEELSGAIRQARRSGRAETAMRNELEKHRETAPDVADITRLLRLWRDTYRPGDTRTKITLSTDRAARVRKAIKQHGAEQTEHAILGATHDEWLMGTHPKLRNQGRKFDDLKYILKDEETIERLADLHRNGGAPGAGGALPPSSGPSRTGLSLLHDLFPDAKKTGEGWMACCPAHEDATASLSFAQGDKGAVIRCFAGCTLDQIAQAAGFDLKALFDPEPTQGRAWKKPPVPGMLPSPERLAAMQQQILRPDIVARLTELRGWTEPTIRKLGLGLNGKRVALPIHNAQGGLVNLLSYQPNEAKRSEREPKTLAVRNRPRNLFPAPESIKGDELWIFEGEPDAVAGHELGLPAVGLPGTNGWKAEYAPRLARARVYVCFDCDIKGRLAADRVARALVDFAGEVRLVDLDPTRDDGWDLSDLLLEGGTAAVVHDMARVGGSVIGLGRDEREAA